MSEIFARCKFRESLDLGLFAFLFSRMASLFSCKHSRELLHYNSRRNGIVETLAFQIFHLGKALSSCRVASWDFSRVPR